jgi:replication fork protection complex subunit Tof1/Swi1
VVLVLIYQKAFLSALLKDIRSERPKITDKDNLRLLFVTKWFLEFFLAMRSKEQKSNVGEDKWNFGLVAEVTERSWIIWVLKRMREAVEEKVRCRFCDFILITSRMGIFIFNRER